MCTHDKLETVFQVDAEASRWLLRGVEERKGETRQEVVVVQR
jgi:hypothetical protein